MMILRSFAVLIGLTSIVGFSDAAYAIPEGILSRNVVVLDKDYRFYHWAPQSKVLNYSKDAYLKETTARTYSESILAYDRSKGQENLWSGMYFAFDPISSTAYGNAVMSRDVRSRNDWALVEIAIPKGTRILNLYTVSNGNMSDGSDDGLSSEEVQWFGERGCRISHMHDLRAARECSQALTAYFKEGSIDGVLYRYGRTDFSFCEGHRDHSSGQQALIIKNPELLTKSKLELFTPASAGEKSQQSHLRAINSFWKYNIRQQLPSFDEIVHEDYSPIDFAVLPAVTVEEKEAFVRQNVFGCETPIPENP